MTFARASIEDISSILKELQDHFQYSTSVSNLPVALEKDDLVFSSHHSILGGDLLRRIISRLDTSVWFGLLNPSPYKQYRWFEGLMYPIVRILPPVTQDEIAELTFRSSFDDGLAIGYYTELGIICCPEQDWCGWFSTRWKILVLSCKSQPILKEFRQMLSDEQIERSELRDYFRSTLSDGGATGLPIALTSLLNG